MTAGQALADGRDRYVAALLHPDPRLARTVVDGLVEVGLGGRRIYLDVLQPALVEVGRRWQLGQITVAHEHLATATTKSIMARLAPTVGHAPALGRTILLACTAGEFHGVGLRMVADFLEGDGWEVLEVGADTPTLDLVELVRAQRPDAVGLSTALTLHLNAAAAAVAALALLVPRPFIVVGGAAYAGDPAIAASVGADAFGVDAGATSAILAERFGR